MEESIHPISEVAGSIVSRTWRDDPIATWSGLDRILGGGFRRGQLITLASRPSMGKSAWVSSLLAQPSLKDRVVAHFDLGSIKEEVAIRHLAARTYVPSAAIREGRIEGEFRADALGQQKTLLIDDCFTDRSIERACSTIFVAEGRLDLVVVDYLQLLQWDPLDPTVSRSTELERSARRLKHLARSLNCCVLLLIQLNRGVECRPNKHPRLIDLPTGAIEEFSDAVIFLYRDAFYDPNTLYPGLAEHHVAKNRMGEPGRFNLRFVSSIPLFQDTAAIEP